MKLPIHEFDLHSQQVAHCVVFEIDGEGTSPLNSLVSLELDPRVMSKLLLLDIFRETEELEVFGCVHLLLLKLRFPLLQFESISRTAPPAFIFSVHFLLLPKNVSFTFFLQDLSEKTLILKKSAKRIF